METSCTKELKKKSTWDWNQQTQNKQYKNHKNDRKTREIWPRSNSQAPRLQDGTGADKLRARYNTKWVTSSHRSYLNYWTLSKFGPNIANIHVESPLEACLPGGCWMVGGWDLL